MPEYKSVFNSAMPVSVFPLSEYSDAEAYRALCELLSPLGFLERIRAGMTVIIKANLVSAMKPKEAATTHPVLLFALCRLLRERGANIIIGDSPGGLYNAAFVGRVYKAAGIRELEGEGVALNDDFGEKSAVFDGARVLHSFTYTSYLDKADMIINFAKLKSHGMMGMSAAAKNMFGAIPGVIKPEYHYRFPRYEDFADMLLDLDEYFHPELSIIDAVVGMEGNGPTAGTPREIGCIMASESPHTLDLIAAKLIGYTRHDVPTLDAANRRGIIPDKAEDVKTYGDFASFIKSDFVHVVERRSLEFSSGSKNPIKRLFGKCAARILRTKPYLVEKSCVGCGICRDICPAKAIVIDKNKKAKIDRRFCIRCFCCQEFCPKSAMRVKRTFVARLFHSENKKTPKT